MRKILWKPHTLKTRTGTVPGYLWAWEEAAEVNVWGFAKSLDEVEARARKLFPGDAIELVRLGT